MEFQYTTTDYGSVFSPKDKIDEPVIADLTSLGKSKKSLLLADRSRHDLSDATKELVKDSIKTIKGVWEQKIDLAKKAGLYQTKVIKMGESEIGTRVRIAFQPSSYPDRIEVSNRLYQLLLDQRPDSSDGDGRVFLQLSIPSSFIKPTTIAFPPMTVFGVEHSSELDFIARREDHPSYHFRDNPRGGPTHWKEWHELLQSNKRSKSILNREWVRDVPSYRWRSDWCFVYTIRVPQWLLDMLNMPLIRGPTIEIFLDWTMAGDNPDTIGQRFQGGYRNTDSVRDDVNRLTIMGAEGVEIKFMTEIPVANIIRFYSNENDQMVNDRELLDKVEGIIRSFPGKFGKKDLDIFNLMTKLPYDKHRNVTIGYLKTRDPDSGILIDLPVAKTLTLKEQLYSFPMIEIRHKYPKNPKETYVQCEYEYFEVLHRLIENLNEHFLTTNPAFIPDEIMEEVKRDVDTLSELNQFCADSERFFQFLQPIFISSLSNFTTMTGKKISPKKQVTDQSQPKRSSEIHLRMKRLFQALSADQVDLLESSYPSLKDGEKLVDFLGLYLLVGFYQWKNSKDSKDLFELISAKIGEPFSKLTPSKIDLPLNENLVALLEPVLSERKLQMILSLKHNSIEEFLIRYSNFILASITKLLHEDESSGEVSLGDLRDSLAGLVDKVFQSLAVTP